jgi:nucleosome-remodeling factor subunit BPTF
VLSGQQILRLPDGRLQLITMPNPSTAATTTSSAATAASPAPAAPQTMVRPTITLRPQQPTLMVSSSPSAQATTSVATPQTRLLVPAGSMTPGSSTITIPARPATSILAAAGGSPTKPLIISTTGRLPGAAGVLSTPGAATQQLVSLASGQQMVTGATPGSLAVVTSQPGGQATIGGLPVVTLQSPATSLATPTVVLQSSQGTSLLSGQSLLARPLTGATAATTAAATSLLSMALPSGGQTLTLGGQKVIIQNSAALNPSSVATTVVMATPTGMRALAGGAPQLQLKMMSTTANSAGAIIRTPLSPVRQVIQPVQVKLKFRYIFILQCLYLSVPNVTQSTMVLNQINGKPLRVPTRYSYPDRWIRRRVCLPLSYGSA